MYFHFSAVSFALLLAAASPLAAQASPTAALEPLIAVHDLWHQLQSGNFIMETSSSFGFRWQSDLRETAESTRKGLTLFGIPVTQATAHFTGNTLDRLTVIFYDRGDNGDIKQTAFNALTAKAMQAINAYTETAGVLRKAQQSDVVQVNGMVWSTPQSQFTLESSDNGSKPQVLSHQIPYRPEFIRLTITPPPVATNFYTQAFLKKSGPFDAKIHVHHNPINGDVMIAGVPMVDQGQKGYCVVASASRLLRYYGKNVDENELAQLADSDSKNGTSLTAMADALRGLTAKLGVQSRAVLPFSDAQFENMVRSYNVEARAHGKPPIDLNRNVNMGSVFDQMDKSILIKVRSTVAAQNRLLQIIQQYIDQGKPLLWSVTLGIVPEKAVNIQGTGGHMRVIIGYNPTTREVLYSDSWGRDFENERMSLANATAITDAIYLVEPIGS